MSKYDTSISLALEILYHWLFSYCGYLWSHGYVYISGVYQRFAKQQSQLFLRNKHQKISLLITIKEHFKSLLYKSFQGSGSSLKKGQYKLWYVNLQHPKQSMSCILCHTAGQVMGQNLREPEQSGCSTRPFNQQLVINNITGDLEEASGHNDNTGKPGDFWSL